MISKQCDQEKRMKSTFRPGTRSLLVGRKRAYGFRQGHRMRSGRRTVGGCPGQPHTGEHLAWRGYEPGGSGQRAWLSSSDSRGLQ